MDRALERALVVVALGGCIGCGPLPDERSPNVEQTAEPILGGVLDTSHDAVAALLYIAPDGQVGGACSSTTVATKGQSGILLTAAHCVVEIDGNNQPTTTPLPADSLFVVPGDDWATALGAYRALEVTVHGSYNGDVDSPFDVAVVRYAGALPSTPSIPILTAAADDITYASPVTFVGYGVTESDDANTRRYSVGQQVADFTTQHLAFDQGSGDGICAGDSGGPALYTTPSGERVAGVTSYGDQLCEIGVAVRVSAQAAFINGVIGAAPPTLDCDECSAAAVAPGNPCEDFDLACSQGSPCEDFVICADGCATPACVDGCATSFAQGAQAYDDLIGCICDDGCATQCATNPTCATPEPSCGGLTSPSPTCTICMQQNCCAQSAACAGDPACAACITSAAPTCQSPAFGALQVCRAGCTGIPCNVTNPSPAGGAGGSAGAAGSGGATGGDASGGANSSGAAGTSSGGSEAGAGGDSMMPAPVVTKSSGCSCRLAPSAPSRSPFLLGLLGLCAVALRRRRRFSFR